MLPADVDEGAAVVEHLAVEEEDRLADEDVQQLRLHLGGPHRVDVGVPRPPDRDAVIGQRLEERPLEIQGDEEVESRVGVVVVLDHDRNAVGVVHALDVEDRLAVEIDVPGGVRRRRVEQLPPEHLRGGDHAAGAAGLGEAGDVLDLPGHLALADEGALALPLDQQTVLAELLNGATNCDSAHSVGGGQLRLCRNLLPRPEAARCDGGVQGLGDLREEGLRARPLQRDLRIRHRGIHSRRRSVPAAYTRGLSRPGSGRTARPAARRPTAVRTGPGRRRARCARAAAGGAPPARRPRPRGP